MSSFSEQSQANNMIDSRPSLSAPAAVWLSLTIISLVGAFIFLEELPMLLLVSISVIVFSRALLNAEHFGFFVCQSIFLLSFTFFSNGLSETPIYPITSNSIVYGAPLALALIVGRLLSASILSSENLIERKFFLKFISTHQLGANLIWVWFFLAILIMLLFHDRVSVTRKILFGISVFSVLFLFYHYLPELFGEKKFFNRFSTTLMATGAIFAVSGIILTMFGIYRIPLLGGYLGLQSIGFTTFPFLISTIGAHPNLSALTYLVCLPILGVLITSPAFKDFTRGKKFVIYASLMAMIAALIFSYSRASYIGIFLASLFLLYFRSKKAFYITLFLIVPLALYVASNFLSSKGLGSTVSRTWLYVISYNIISKDLITLLFGTGIDGYTLFIEAKEQFGLFDTAPSPHNVYVFFLLEFGLICAIIFYAFVISTLFRAFKWLSRNAHHEEYEKILSFSVMFFGIMFHQFFEDTIILFNNFVSAVFFVCCGVINLTARSESKTSSRLYP